MKTKTLTFIILIFTLVISTLAGADAPVLTIDGVEGNHGTLTINYRNLRRESTRFSSVVMKRRLIFGGSMPQKIKKYLDISIILLYTIYQNQ